MAINKPLLRGIMKHIKAEPRRLNMAFLLEHYEKNEVVEAKRLPPCGTVGCIAGWACILNEKNPSLDDISMNGWKRGRKHLKLDESQANRLFTSPGNAWESMEHWPNKFIKKYNESKTARGRVNATIARIEHFLKTNGAE